MATQTCSVLAPSGQQQIAVRSGTVYTADANGLITGVALGDEDTVHEHYWKP